MVYVVDGSPGNGWRVEVANCLLVKGPGNGPGTHLQAQP